MNKDDLKLIYVLKIGENGRGEGLYEFMFGDNPAGIDTEALGWDDSPASQNAQPPSAKDVKMVLALKTKKIDFICLHNKDDRPYKDGYNTIHCLAYEDQSEEANHDIMYDEMPLIVFHYTDSAAKVKDIFMTRDMMLKEIELDNSQISTDDEEAVYEEESEDEDED